MADPIRDARNQKFTRAELDSFFKGSGRIQQEVKENNPALYAEYRTEYERLGGIGKSLAPHPAPNVPYKAPQRSYTPEELKLRGEFTKEYCQELFGSGNSKAATELFKTNESRYQDAKDAAISFNILPPRSTPRPQPAPVASPEWTMRISDELAKESNLPIGTIVNEKTLEQLCLQKTVRAKETKEAADAKLESDRQAELKTLTARQQADEAIRLQKIADLDRIVELTAPKKIE
jgi:hypothetical protein